MEYLATWQFWLIAIFFASATYINLRGDKRLSFVQQLRDHSSIMAPVNAFMYIFSKIPSGAYPDKSAFPELEEIQKHWKAIRDEALELEDLDAIFDKLDRDEDGALSADELARSRPV